MPNSQPQIPKVAKLKIGKKIIFLSLVIVIIVTCVICGVLLILKNDTPRNEILLNNTIILTKQDSERIYNFDLTKGDHVQIDFSVTGDSIHFKIYNSTFTWISIIGELSWGYLWPPINSQYQIPSGRYTFWFKTLGDNSTVTIKLIRNPS